MDAYYLFLGLWVLINVVLVWAVIHQLREGTASLERVWHLLLALILVVGFSIPLARHLYGSAFELTLAPAGVRLGYLDPRPARLVPYEEIEALEVCRHYRVSDEDEITDSSWRIAITAAGECYETFDGVDREMMLAVADRIADRSRVPIEWFWMIGRFEDPRPAAQAQG